MKDKRIEIRLSEELYVQLRRICTEKGITISEFVRTKIQEPGEPVRTSVRTDKDCTDECTVDGPIVGRHADVVITDDTGDFREESQGKQPVVFAEQIPLGDLSSKNNPTDYGEFIDGKWTPYVEGEVNPIPPNSNILVRKVDPASDPQPAQKKISPLLAYAKTDKKIYGGE